MDKNEKIYIPYIFSLDEYGYLQENKFLKEVTVENIPHVGQEVVTFYDERVSFYNLSHFKTNEGTYYIIENDKLVQIDENCARQKILDLLPAYIAQLASIDCINLHGNTRGEESHFDKLKNGLEKVFNISFPDVSNLEFDSKKYIELHNSLLYYSRYEEGDISLFFSKIFSGVNTILGIDEIIPVSLDSNCFCTYSEYNGKTEENFLDYTRASLNISTVMDYHYYTSIKNKSTKKI